METRTSRSWLTRGGNMDPLNLDHRFPITNRFGIPDLLPQHFDIDQVVDYKVARSKTKPVVEGAAVHFFIDDYVFEGVWNSPTLGLQHVAKYGMAFSPQFSYYDEWADALRIFNQYRNMWVGRYWQEHGILVIPSLNWGREDTFEWCFAGIPNESSVAVDILGIRSKESKEIFRRGFEELLQRKNPSFLYWVGETSPIDFDKYLPNKRFPTYWEQRREKFGGKSYAKDKE